MESIGSELERTRRVRRTFTKQFKADLVARVNAGEQSTAQIALEHNINANLLHKWVTSSRESNGCHQMVPVAVAQIPRQDHSDASGITGMFFLRQPAKSRTTISLPKWHSGSSLIHQSLDCPSGIDPWVRNLIALLVETGQKNCVDAKVHFSNFHLPDIFNRMCWTCGFQFPGQHMFGQKLLEMKNLEVKIFFLARSLRGKL